ncbi:glycosyl hydrolase 115 family protein [Prevotella sp. E2-28]|uniref:glycosyl hydrolase 115 family protein n=1 Tax=Prevotella sp. E2-28 TaxID=2913620 RepID=UPI001ED9DB5D|nr:glycosyl hydrolase 115 family protein [Prevotella sp. E2-28]UKK54258.1 glycosyl hydrolase 115 family protein [Prevotella sp. E2-28]
MKKILNVIVVLMAISVGTKAADMVWFDGQYPVSYQVVGKVDPVVRIALQMFESDMEMVTGMKPVAAKKAAIRIIQGKGSDDGFRLSVKNGQIVVEGHNGRGAAYGLLELSRMAGVSPWVWWGDVVPEKKARLSLPETFSYEHTPSVAYRGIFINDEDWSLRQWSKDNMGPQTYRRLFELMLRLRANTLWPAMHEGTPGFFTVPDNQVMADSFGIVVGSSHCEPLLRNNVAEWNHAQRGPYNYITNRQQVQQYWIERLREVKGSEKLFTIGMRGIHDGAMEGVKTKQEQLTGLQQVIDDQRQLLKKYYRKDVENVPQVFIPYKEVLEILESGLRVPDDVTLMWCDDNYGYLTRLPDADQQKRQGGGGVYYHLSYWGRPHDYLWLTTTQPGLIYHEMRTAYEHNCRKLWIANVHDPKVAAYDLELFLDLAWDIKRLSPGPSLRERGVITLEEHLAKWLCTQFGTQVGKAIFPAMKEFYHLNAIRKPEFMGWTQVELDKKKYPGGKSVPDYTALSLQEGYERMEAFARMEAVVDTWRPLVRESRRDAYFAHVLYPVHAAAAMTRKMLSDELGSLQAYDEIQQLTERYNMLNGGKWHGLMSAAPRNLPVFGKVRTKFPQHSSVGQLIARNACDYQSASHGVSVIPMLGHSMNAVAIPKGGEVVYEVSYNQEGEAILYTAMIPTQPNDKGDLRYQVTIDDQEPVVISLKTPYRSERWKQSVLRGQSLNKTSVRLTKGSHRLKIKALDDHIIVDQWILDFCSDRKFYVIPVSKK